MPLEYVAAIALCSGALGALLGAWLSDSRWAANADNYVRIHFDGSLYYVVREGDMQKAREVLEGMLADERAKARRAKAGG